MSEEMKKIDENTQETVSESEEITEEEKVEEAPVFAKGTTATDSTAVIKENWFASKMRKFREWKTETGIKIDRWSRKKPF